jgi:hypothetical protein
VLELVGNPIRRINRDQRQESLRHIMPTSVHTRARARSLSEVLKALLVVVV